MKDRIQLPFQFNVEKLQQDVLQIEQNTDTWIDHFVQQNYEGNWSVIPLRGTKGATHPVQMIYSDPTVDEYEDTPFLQNGTYLKDVLDQFKTELQAVRLMKLSTGSIIKEHRDHDLDIESGVVRIHIPIITNDQVEFYLNNSRVIMKEGTCWYLRLSDHHRVVNHGPDRIHLVLDMKVNDWLKKLL